MSLARTTPVMCPKCGNKQDFTIWDSLNATVDPAKKAELLKLELTRFICESCGESHHVFYPILYNDSRADFMVWLTSDGREPDFGSAALASFGRLMSPKKRLRYVGSYYELIEKIRIFDAGLDDHVVEWFKILMSAAEPELAVGDLFFLGIQSVESRDEIGLFHVKANDRRVVTFPKSLYCEVEKSFAPILRGFAPADQQWLRVDRSYLKKNGGM